MQITIQQSEIELAVKKYIASILTLQEGAKITIELRATRGETGFTGIVDITSGDEVVEPVVEPAAAPVPVQKRAYNRRNATETSETSNEEQSEEQTGDQQSEALAPEYQEEKPTQKVSLFGNLTRPDNSK